MVNIPPSPPLPFIRIKFLLHFSICHLGQKGICRHLWIITQLGLFLGTPSATSVWRRRASKTPKHTTHPTNGRTGAWRIYCYGIFFLLEKWVQKNCSVGTKKLFIIINLSTKVEHTHTLSLSPPMTRSWVLDWAHIVKNLCNRFLFYFSGTNVTVTIMYTHVSWALYYSLVDSIT